MSKVSVRCVDSEENLHLTVEYAHPGGGGRVYNACRPKTENIGNSLARIGQNINKHLNKKKRKKDNAVQEEVVLAIFQSDGVTRIAETTCAEDALCHGYVINIQDAMYTVDVNPPYCLAIVIPKSIMVGFPLFPKLDVEFCSLDDSQYIWEKIKYKETDDGGAQVGKPKKPDPAKIIDRKEISRSLSYTPTNDDIGYRLAVTCTPRLGDREGKPATAESKFDVTVGPGLCPFETRHLYTQKETGPGE